MYIYSSETKWTCARYRISHQPLRVGCTTTIFPPPIYNSSLAAAQAYNLTFSGDGGSATIRANTVFGVLRGLETFSQLVDCDKWTARYTVSAQNVVDYPRFPYRGLLVDAARHYLPPKLLMTIMDGMMYTKMNSLLVVSWGVAESCERG